MEKSRPLKQVEHYGSPRDERAGTPCRATGKSNQGCSGGNKKAGGGTEHSVTWVSAGKPGRVGGAHSVGLAGWDNSGGLWGIQVVPSCPVSTWP